MNRWAAAAFHPARVALVGASREPGKLGRILLDNLREHPIDEPRELVAIHPTEKDLLGIPAYRSLVEAPPVDLAVVATPAAAAPEVVADCARAHVKVALILSGGFAEVGPEGQKLQERVAEAARGGSVRIIGPNCFGLVDVRRGLNASMSLGLPLPGGVALFTQSGAYGMAATSRSRSGEIGISKVLAAGNALDIDAADALCAWAEDDDTRVIALFLESIRDGAALMAAARIAARRKPVVATIVGRRAAGRRAAASHTAALTGDARVAAAALRQAGVTVVEDGRTLFDVAAALDRRGPLAGRRVAVITNSGGSGVELADLLEEEGLEVPQLSAGLERTIAALLPVHGSAKNPIDVTTDWKRFPAMYGGSLRALLDSGEVDAVVPVLLQRSALSEPTCDAVIAEAGAAGRPVHVMWVPPLEAEANRRRLLAAGIPCHDGAFMTARVLARCRAVATTEPPAAGPPLPRPDAGDIDEDGWLAPAALFTWLETHGLPVAGWRVVADAGGVAAAAAELEGKVVLKALRRGVVHKAAAGAVKLGLAGPAEARAAAEALAGALGDGPFLVQRQASAGLELLVGAVRDPRFGPVVLVGVGGVWAEAFADVALRVTPFDAAEAAAAWGELRARAALGSRLATVSALAAGVSGLCARAPWIAELDLNPIIIDPRGAGGPTIVDARLRVAGGADPR